MTTFIPGPSLVLNAYQANGQGYNTGCVAQGTETRYIPRGMPVADIVAIIRNTMTLPQFRGTIRTLVFKCHGSPGDLGIGSGINSSSIPLFAHDQLGGKVEEVWFRACLVARITNAEGTCTSDRARAALNPVAVNGHAFCQRFSDTIGAPVVASTELQGASDAVVGTLRHGETRSMPPNRIDYWEGLVLRFDPKTGVRQTRSPSAQPVGDGRIILPPGH